MVNLSMDFLTVYIASKLTHARSSMLRFAAASSVGALYGVFSVIFIQNHLLSVLGSIAVSLVLTVIAFGRSGGAVGLLRQSAVVWGCGALLGGVMSMLMAMGEPVYLDNGGSASYSRYYILTFAAAVALARLLTGRTVRKDVALEVTVNGETVSLTALVDSGNLLTEPFSGTPVVILSAALFSRNIVELWERMGGTGESGGAEGSLRLRVIPQKTVGASGLLYGFVPDEVKVGGRKKAAVVALERVPEGYYGGFSGLVPLCLCP